MISKERQEILDRIKKYESEEDFDHDVENDPPAKTLEPNEIDYLRKKWRNKIARFFVKRAADKGIDVIICTGKLSKHMYEGASAFEKEELSAAQKREVYYYETRDEMLKELSGILKHGDNILVKASHGMHFEQVVEYLSK